MTVKHFPEVRIREFIGVDFTNEPEKLALGALVDAYGFRTDEDGNLRTMEGLGSTPAGASAGSMLDAVWYRFADKIIAVNIASTTATVYEIPRSLGAETSKGTYTVLATATVANVVDLFDKVYIQLYKEILKVWDNSTLTSVQANLDGAGAADLKFAGIAPYGGHLLGWGYGDATGTGGEETNDLGPDREEVLRWSDLGNPGTWTAAHWIMVGSRGIPVLAAHAVFGRLAVMKTEGVWLLYGDLEQNFPQLEPLMTETDRALGVTGPHASCVYDGVLYWMSPRGPMRWSGEGKAQYIGRAVEDATNGIGSNHKSAASSVFPIPAMDAICFCSGDTGVPTFPGGGNPQPGSGTVGGWLWSVPQQNWIGRWQETTTGGGIVNAFIAPATDGTYQAIYSSDLRTWGDNWTSVFVSNPEFTTQEIVLNEGNSAVVKGAAFVSDSWANLDNFYTVSFTHDGHGAAFNTRLWVASGAPTATAVGQCWYDTTNDLSKVWDGTTWKVIRGLEKNVAFVPCNLVCRRMQLNVVASTQSSAFKQVFQEISLAVQPL